jgi:hypothetical protein
VRQIPTQEEVSFDQHEYQLANTEDEAAALDDTPQLAYGCKASCGLLFSSRFLLPHATVAGSSRPLCPLRGK